MPFWVFLFQNLKNLYNIVIFETSTFEFFKLQSKFSLKFKFWIKFWSLVKLDLISILFF